jgi:hypothetical protein
LWCSMAKYMQILENQACSNLIANQVFDWIHIALYKQSFDDKRNHGGIQPQLRMRIWPLNNTSASATNTS